MMGRVAHRGPDASATWFDHARGITLGHTRLAIQDLTAAGAQPMVSPCGRFALVLNGEIYNHWELRKQLGHKQRWCGRSDTETLLKCIAAWGVLDTLQRVNGMFALALWDRAEQRLLLARDRLGEKPLYWGAVNGAFVFASELGPILTSGLGPFGVDGDAVNALLNLGYIPDPLSILEDVHKLEPGHMLEVWRGDDSFAWRDEAYWSLARTIETALDSRPALTESAWMERVEAAFERAVRLRLISDVPLGAFLSGGVDSGLIVAAMSRVASGPVRTFTIAMPTAWNEAPRARQLADHLGTVHTEIPISEQDCLDVIPELPRLYTEPLGDSSQIPTYLVSKAARREVTVALSGDGGDELFAGYHRHFHARRIWNALRRLPAPVHRTLARTAASAPGQRTVVAASVLLSGGGVDARRMLQIQKVGRLIAAHDVPDLYRRLVMQWPAGQAPTANGASWELPLSSDLANLPGSDAVEQLMALDISTALPGDMLVKVDRASMAHNLEVRVPFLDHEFLAVAWSVPPSLKIRNGQGKTILRRILARHAPPGWMDAPDAQRKSGFGIPLASWLRSDLRDWSESLLSVDALRSNPFLDTGRVRSRWDDFVERKHAWEHPLWSILMLQAWMDEHRRWLKVG